MPGSEIADQLASLSPLQWRLFLYPFFLVVFIVLYAVTYSVLLGIRDNYLRYAQKADLQWTGPGRKSSLPRTPWVRLLIAAVLTTAVVVEFIL